MVEPPSPAATSAPLDINSVLRTDQSTLAVIAWHSQELRKVTHDFAVW